MPSVSEDSSSSPLTTPPVSGSPKLQFSVVECVLFTLHQLIRKVRMDVQSVGRGGRDSLEWKGHFIILLIL